MPMALRGSSGGLGLRQCVLADAGVNFAVKVRHNLKRMRLDPGLPVLCLLGTTREVTVSAASF